MKIRLALLLSILLVTTSGCSQQAAPQHDKSPKKPQKAKSHQTTQTNFQSKELKTALAKLPKKSSEFYGPADPQYKMNLVYHNQNHTVTGSMTVNFTNNLKKTLQHLYFNAWANADFFKKYGGGVTVHHVIVNGKKASYDLHKTVLDISGLSIQPNESTVVKMDFKVSVPHHADRFGWNGTTVSDGTARPFHSGTFSRFSQCMTRRAGTMIRISNTGNPSTP